MSFKKNGKRAERMNQTDVVLSMANFSHDADVTKCGHDLESSSYLLKNSI
jgi:hypothetical protein